MKHVVSSNISHIGYADGVLSVRFKSSPTIYDYSGVTPEEHKAFVEADSIGAHFHQFFKNRSFTKRES